MGTKRAGVLVGILLGVSGIGLLVPAILNARNSAKQQELSNNLKKVLLAVHSCHDAHKKFPPAFENYGDIEYE